MGLVDCIVINLLKATGRTSLDRLARLAFLVDKLGGFEAFDWGRIDLVITSPELLNLVEQLKRSSVISIVGDFVTLVNSNYEPDCGWLRDRVNSVINYVIGRYGSLSDGELEDVVNSVFEGVY